MDSKEARWLLQEKYQGRITPAAKQDLTRFKAGEPVDYLIGFVEFAGCRIDLSQKPLIPRPETEYWVLQAIQELKKDKRENICCLDMFAGSGCVGVAILKHISKAHIDFAEKEQRFKKQILLNLKKNDIPLKRARIFTSNVFSNVKGKYDYIFANPPYVATTRWKSVQPSVAKYEPREALIAGKDGLLYIKKFLKDAKNHLKLKGKIYLEFDSPQKKGIEKLLKKFGYSSWQFHKDQYGKYRFTVIT
ncbi:MAG: HemK family protein methyltransferase [bacterium]|nr:HemK family protein methyltransferase [bacterium]